MKPLYATSRKDRYDSYEFLPSYIESMERPPSPSARVTAIVISILVSLAFIWALWGELDIHATAYGRLILPSRSQHIQPYEPGKIAEILVKDGTHVKAGDKLLVLNIAGSAQEMRRHEAQKSFGQLELARYKALLSSQPLKDFIIPNDIEKSIAARTKAHLMSTWQAHQAMLNKFDTNLAINRSEQIANQTSIKYLQKLLHNIEQRLASSRKLAKSNIMPKMELLAKEKEALETKLSIATKHKELKILQARANRLKKDKISYITQTHKTWHDGLNKAAAALLIATQELAKAQDRSRLQILEAPLDGIVQQLAVHTIGGIVQAGQTLMIIAPHDAPKQAEIDITNSHIGFVSPGQWVTVKVEAFPYSRYGTINGKVLNLSRDSVKRNRPYTTESVFPAQIELEQNYIMVHGKPVSLTPGMAITAEIKIGKRRVIDYLLSPISAYRSQSCREP
ncbi:MAG: HlyD family type I secretion periplasmic adaptor subunit [Candidatus Cardinium sp.]|uniref:HlyD family type I secretion periplasmic adaptor subunit n=1 Tax=Cardinium endosymbiont of Dermatophagoides farinae TaxID=2597823 RepID=UPI00118273C9|nr:HlyD family type I secretion periplasmic adaptor subunit [Cardinium endosymbiont of Dermatophagoides farinae]TSJ80776.1 HlyD family type I secretion periplasmic adaptor subunit [Cardinium endosymbiont of Dermatophagoides farinae]UWW96780.1 MAG: HlyD family type I secretion periplasmic adaptor subunit [Candidatus Cardinium sp.]